MNFSCGIKSVAVIVVPKWSLCNPLVKSYILPVHRNGRGQTGKFRSPNIFWPALESFVLPLSTTYLKTKRAARFRPLTNNTIPPFLAYPFRNLNNRTILILSISQHSHSLSFSDPLWCANRDKIRPTYASSPYNYNSYATATQQCQVRANCKAVTYKQIDETWTIRAGTSYNTLANAIDYTYCRPSPQGLSLQSEFGVILSSEAKHVIFFLLKQKSRSI